MALLSAIRYACDQQDAPVMVPTGLSKSIVYGVFAIFLVLIPYFILYHAFEWYVTNAQFYSCVSLKYIYYNRKINGISALDTSSS